LSGIGEAREPRVALVHDWVTGLRGGERVLDELAGLFPSADLYTLFYREGTTTDRIDRLCVRSSLLDGIWGVALPRQSLLPLFPWAIERFELRDYDIVISTSHAVAKGVRVAPGIPHLCYCFTPMRYVWGHEDVYIGRGLRRVAAAPLIAYLRKFDRRTAGPDRVTQFCAISETVSDRIRRYYGRNASVVYPPVATERIVPNGMPPKDYYLMVAAFVPYKREDIAIEAFRRMGIRLVVAGDGPGRSRLAAAAGPNTEFVGRVSDAELADLYAGCRALVFPSEEDFGIVPVEVQAAGRPVIAFGAGGATESVIRPTAHEPDPRGPTGVLFYRQSADALVAAVRHFESIELDFDPARIRANAERFSSAVFRSAIIEQVAATRAIPSKSAQSNRQPKGIQ
jgi:glycosyltransferase involved in cell wall biosynthesis